MEAVISDLLKRFDTGTLTRRELIQGLAILAAASGTASAAGSQEAGFKVAKIDHVSIQVSDLPRSVAFYQNVFGLSVVSQDKPNEIVRMGTTKALVSLHHKSPTALVDHFAIGVDALFRYTIARYTPAGQQTQSLGLPSMALMPRVRYVF